MNVFEKRIDYCYLVWEGRGETRGKNVCVFACMAIYMIAFTCDVRI